ncbi:hypothetical protein F4779DRAFT_621352 [Xylariaceae sp. FL0662B]|nr:hypothetical protein F4779DRAFT_621352 [Xylariaceae sp. FL0662B]
MSSSRVGRSGDIIQLMPIELLFEIKKYLGFFDTMSLAKCSKGLWNALKLPAYECYLRRYLRFIDHNYFFDKSFSTDPLVWLIHNRHRKQAIIVAVEAWHRVKPQFLHRGTVRNPPPLLLAAQHGRLDIMAVLLDDYNCDLLTTSLNPRKSLSWLYQHGWLPGPIEMLKIVFRPSNILTAAIDGHQEDLALSIIAMSVLNGNGLIRPIALFAAARHNLPTIIQAIIDSGCLEGDVQVLLDVAWKYSIEEGDNKDALAGVQVPNPNSPCQGTKEALCKLLDLGVDPSFPPPIYISNEFYLRIPNVSAAIVLLERDIDNGKVTNDELGEVLVTNTKHLCMYDLVCYVSNIVEDPQLSYHRRALIEPFRDAIRSRSAFSQILRIYKTTATLVQMTSPEDAEE